MISADDRRQESIYVVPGSGEDTASAEVPSSGTAERSELANFYPASMNVWHLVGCLPAETERRLLLNINNTQATIEQAQLVLTA
jgi:hypothetical protein